MDKSQICISCNECCKFMTFSLPKDFVQAHRTFYEHRGCQLFDEGDTVAVRVPSVCPQLSANGICKVYPFRSEACRLYDGRDDPYVDCQLPERIVETQCGAVK